MSDYTFPKVLKIFQKFPRPKIENLESTISDYLNNNKLKEVFRGKKTIAIGCSSRGIASYKEIIYFLIKHLKSVNLEPFIFPCMGSHGSATAEGQKKILETYGITEDSMKVPILSSMDTICIDKNEKVYVDKIAFTSDGIIVVNRVKPHTSFRGETESGLTKMLSIGIGKIKGANQHHSKGMDVFGSYLPKIANIIINSKKVLLGVGIVENAYGEVAQIKIMDAIKIKSEEPKLLAFSRKIMPRLFFLEIDILIIDEMGKNISGAGFDPNVTGRGPRDFKNWAKIKVKRIVVLRLSDKSFGNATGVGKADIITKKLFSRIDFSSTYLNVITSRNLEGGAIPIIMNSDKDAIKLAINSIKNKELKDLKIVRIQNTSKLNEIQVSENLRKFVTQCPEKFKIISHENMGFDHEGNLL